MPLCLSAYHVATGFLPLVTVVTVGALSASSAAAAVDSNALVGKFAVPLPSIAIEPFQLPKNWQRPSAPYQVNLTADRNGSFSGTLIRPDGKGTVPIAGMLNAVSGWSGKFTCADGKSLFLSLRPKAGRWEFILAEDAGGYIARGYVSPLDTGVYQGLLEWNDGNRTFPYPDYSSVPPDLVGKPMSLPKYFGRMTLNCSTPGTFSFTLEGLQALETESNPIKIVGAGAVGNGLSWKGTAADEKGTKFQLELFPGNPGVGARVTVMPAGITKPMIATAILNTTTDLASLGEAMGAASNYTVSLEPGQYVGDGPSFDANNAKDRVVGGYGTLIPIGAGKPWILAGRLSNGAAFSSTTYRQRMKPVQPGLDEQFAVFTNGISGSASRNYQLLGKIQCSWSSDWKKGELFLSTSYLYPRTETKSEFYWGQNLSTLTSAWDPSLAKAWNFMNPLDGGVFMYGEIDPVMAYMRVGNPHWADPIVAGFYSPGTANPALRGEIKITKQGIVTLEINNKKYSGVWHQERKCVVGYENSEASPVWAPFHFVPAANP